MGKEGSTRVLAVEAGDGEGRGGSGVKCIVDKAAWEHEQVAGVKGGGEVGVSGVNEANEKGTGDKEEDLGGTRVDMRGKEATGKEVDTCEREALGIKGGEGRGGGGGDGDASERGGGGGGVSQEGALEASAA